MTSRPPLLFLAAAALALAGCASTRPPLPTVPRLDLERFMGDWYVVAHIPASLEKNAFDAVESYRLEDDGSIATTYVFREGGHDGERKRYTPRGFVRDRETNATWGMQFVWPIRMEYLVVHVDEAYSESIIGRTDRDHVWVMTRRPDVSRADHDRLAGLVAGMGYDVSKLRRVPHRPVAVTAP
jgi:apolipoprotein D and lipocalin family protein